MRQFAGWTAMFGLLLVAAVIAELPFVTPWIQTIDETHDRLLGVAAGVAAFGFVVFMGGILSMLMASGDPLTHEEVEATLSRQRGMGEPAVWRASAHRVIGTAVGRRAANEATFAGMKEAFRSGEWRRDPQWRRLFVITFGAALLFYGLFGLFVVVGPPLVKVLMTGAMIYVTGMIAYGLARA
jgi:hypothetical protein